VQIDFLRIGSTVFGLWSLPPFWCGISRPYARSRSNLSYRRLHIYFIQANYCLNLFPCCPDFIRISICLYSLQAI